MSQATLPELSYPAAPAAPAAPAVRSEPALQRSGWSASGLRAAPHGARVSRAHPNGDLFGNVLVAPESGSARFEQLSLAGERRSDPANGVRFASGAGQDHHFRMAMNVARRIGRIGRREQAGRLICHHLRCMLDEQAVRSAR